MKSDILISLQGGPDATERTTLDLRDWIKNEQIAGVQSVERLAEKPERGKMGVDPLTALAVVLGSAAVVELVRSIHVWIRTRRPETTLKITRGAKILEIKTDHVGSQEELLRKFETLAS